MTQHNGRSDLIAPPQGASVPVVTDRLAELGEELARIGRRLEHDSNWRALRYLDQSKGGSTRGAQEFRAALVGTLAHNPDYSAWLRTLSRFDLLAAASRSLPDKSAAEAALAHLDGTLDPVTGDDLTLIRGIDPKCARCLNVLGVTRFSDIASWTTQDVRRVSEGLVLGRSVSRQNWIEQAALLAAERPHPSFGPGSVPWPPRPDAGSAPAQPAPVDTLAPAPGDGGSLLVVAAPPRVASAAPPPSPTPAPWHDEPASSDVQLLGLDGEMTEGPPVLEASVSIVPGRKVAATRERGTSPPPPVQRSLQDQLQRVRAASSVAGPGYAALRRDVEEAEIIIIHPADANHSANPSRRFLSALDGR